MIPFPILKSFDVEQIGILLSSFNDFRIQKIQIPIRPFGKRSVFLKHEILFRLAPGPVNFAASTPKRHDGFVLFGLKPQRVYLQVGIGNAIFEMQMRNVSKKQKLESAKADVTLSVFQQFLKRKLEGESIDYVSVVKNDRILYIYFKGGLKLEVQLFPAHPNMILYAPNGDILIQNRLAKTQNGTVPIVQSRGEEIRLGPSSIWPEDITVSDPNMVFSNRLYCEQVERTIEEDQLQGRIKPLLKLITERSKDRKKGLENTGKKLDLLNQKLENFKSLDELKAHGPSRLDTWPQDTKENRLSLFSWDPNLDFYKNLNVAFDQLKKVKAEIGEWIEKVKSLEEDFEKLQGLRNELESIELHPPYDKAWAKIDDAELILGLSLDDSRLDRQASSGRLKMQRAAKAGDASIIGKQFMSRHGMKIRVGRNERENAQITFKLSKGNDVWLHVRGRPGAHAMIELPSNKSASLETLIDAAQVVAYYSDFRDGESADVDYTFRKYVKRVSTGSKTKTHLAKVTYAQEKTLHITVSSKSVHNLKSF